MPQIRASGGVAVTNDVFIENKGSFTISGTNIGTTETSIVIPAGTVSFRIQAAAGSGAARLIISHTTGGTGVTATSFDISAGAYWAEDLLKGNSFTIYIKATKANTDVQILTWA